MRRSNKPSVRESSATSRPNEPSALAPRPASSARPSLPSSQPRLSSSLRHATTPSALSPGGSPSDTVIATPMAPTSEYEPFRPVPTKTAREPEPVAAAKPPRASFTDKVPHPSLEAYPLGHQPFIDLSPTVSPNAFSPGAKFLERKQSTASTPQSSVPFRPAQAQSPTQADEGEGPSFEDVHTPPDLYKVVLKINSDPRLTPWWDNLTRVLRDAFSAERAVLAIPIDATDIENVPWVLRAAFDVSGLDQKRLKVNTDGTSRVEVEKQPLTNSWRSLSMKRSTQPRRPALNARHSFAGHEAPRARCGFADQGQPSPSEGCGQIPVQRPLRKLHFTDAPDSVPLEPVSDLRLDSSTLITTEAFPHAPHEAELDVHTSVFAPLRVLESEPEPLVKSTHIMRVLDIGKTLVITRSYVISPHDVTDGKEVHSAVVGKHRDGGHRKDSEPPSSTYAKTRLARNKTGHIVPSSSGHRRFPKEIVYEEVEQLPPSPWSHSPAPSPAVQADPDENPFFTSAQVEEDSFAPGDNDHDYSQTGPVEAIGIDKASTIIHLPLYHPLLSNSASSSDVLHGQKAPVAILSLQSKIVPYPQSLLDSLKHLGSHIATSYHTSCQLLHHDAVDNFQRRSTNRHSHTESQISPQSSSMASPSRSSTYSRHSPAGSNLASPATARVREPVGAPESRPSPSTLHEAPSYFDQRKGKSSVMQFLNMAHAGASSSGQDDKDPHDDVETETHSDPIALLSAGGVTDPADKLSRALRDVSHGINKKDGNVAAHDALPLSSERLQMHAPSKSARKHTVLHSNGADFEASFQTLPQSTALPSHAHSPGADDHNIAPPSEKLLRLIIDAAPIHMVITEPVTGKLSWFNTKFLVYDGRTPKQIVRHPYEWIAREDRQSYIDAWTACLASGHQFQRKVRLKRFDGKHLWFFVRAVPLRDVNQNIVHWLGTAIDINDHHLAEVETRKQSSIAEANAKYRALADSCPQITFTASKNAGITLCNNQWLLYSGQSEEQARGIGFLQHVHPDDLSKCRLPTADSSGGRFSNVPVSVSTKPRRKLNRTTSGSKPLSRSDASSEEESKAIAGPSEMPQTRLAELADAGILRVKRNEVGRIEYDTEVRLQNREGQFRWHMVKVVLTDSSASADSGEQTWFGSCSDINDHKELAIKLKHAMEAKSRFVSNMSHEMRTPLNGISGNISLMSATALTDEQIEFLNAVRSSAEGLQQLVNDVLDFSKAEAGMMTLQMEVFHVRSIIEEVNDTMAVKAIERGIELNFIVDDKVPVAVVGDKGRLRQVLWNIVSNAIKFTSEGEVLVCCETVEDENGPPSPTTYDQGKSDAHDPASEEGTMIQFTVSDTGAGFSEQDKVKLFHRFSQIDGSSTRQHGGTGLGLVISKALVELHGGTMSAESEVGKGAQFMFSLKVGRANPTHDSSLKPSIWRGRVSSQGLKPQSTLATVANIGTTMFSEGLHGSPQPYDMPSKVSDTTSVSGTESASISSQSTAAGLSTAASSLDHSIPDPASKPADTMSNEPTIMPSGPSTARSGPSQMLCNVLVSCPRDWALDAAVHHVRSVAPTGVPLSVLKEQSLDGARKLLLDVSLTFSHVILSNPQSDLLVETLQRMLASAHLARACIIIISDIEQKLKIRSLLGKPDLEEMVRKRRLAIILKPLKPSKLAPFFDPNKSREMSTDHNQHSALQTVTKERRLYDRVREEFSDRDIRVLIVEDNPTNVNVIRGFFRRVKIAAEVANDGVECTDMVFKHDPNYYSLILCDLQMPNKDGLQTCREVRDWERKSKRTSRIPIVALSANVLGEVSEECKRAGFDYYLQKPIDYGELSTIMTTLMS